MSLPEPRANPILLGHAAAEQALLETARAGRMHHAWLLTGRPGIGKATLAFRFARWLLAGSPGSDLALGEMHPVFRRVAAGTHADLLTVGLAYDEKRKRQRTEIVIDDARGIPDFLRLTPAEGGWRVVVLDDADALNRNAANAVLKILEEPPQRAVLLLVSAAPGRLLPTIRSRCRRLTLSGLAATDMETLLARARPDLPAANRARLIGMAEGSPGQALLLADEDGLAVAALVREVLAALPDVPSERTQAVADALGRTEGAFSTFMDMLRAALAASVRAAARGQADAEQARLAGLRPLAAWTDVWHALGRLQDETERFHQDRRQALVMGIGLLSGG